MKIKFYALVCVLVMVLIISPAALADEDNPALPSLPYYGEFSGIVVSVEPWNVESYEGEALIVLLENEEGGKANFIVDEVTYFLTDNELKKGAQVIGYYLNNLPMITIYPPRYHAMLMAVDVPGGHFVKVARFDDELVSDDNMLKLNIDKKTKIHLFDGEAAPVDLELGGLRLAVFYGVSSRSIPALTTPDRIIVLALTDAVALPEPEEDPAEVEFAWNGMPLVVEDKLLEDAPPVYVLADGTVMTPLRAVAEALGFKVDWQEDRTVSLDGVLVLTIGKTEYTALDNGTVKLEVAPELYDDRTFVPLAFFKDVLKMNNAYVLEGQVVINNGDIVE